MRVNVYAEELTDKIEIVTKQTPDGEFTGLRIYLELPVTVPRTDIQPAGPLGVDQVRGPFMHHADDNDSAAITIWGKSQLRDVLAKALAVLDQHHIDKQQSVRKG